MVSLVRAASVAVLAALLLLAGPRVEAQRLNYLSASFDNLSNSAQAVKLLPGAFVAYECYNPNATLAYLQTFDSAGTVTVGTTPPNKSYPVQPGTTGIQSPQPQGQPLGLTSGLQVAATTTPTGAIAPASPLTCDIMYR